MPVDKKTEICGPLTMRRSTRLQVMQMSKQPEVDRDSGGGGHKGNVSSEDTLSLHQESEEDDDFTPQLGHSRGRPSATIRSKKLTVVLLLLYCIYCIDRHVLHVLPTVLTVGILLANMFGVRDDRLQTGIYVTSIHAYIFAYMHIYIYIYI